MVFEVTEELTALSGGEVIQIVLGELPPRFLNASDAASILNSLEFGGGIVSPRTRYLIEAYYRLKDMGSDELRAPVSTLIATNN